MYQIASFKTLLTIKLHIFFKDLSCHVPVLLIVLLMDTFSSNFSAMRPAGHLVYMRDIIKDWPPKK